MRHIKSPNKNQRSYSHPKQMNKGLPFVILFGFFAITSISVKAKSSLSFELEAISTDTSTINVVCFDNIESFVRNDSLYISFDLVLHNNILKAEDVLHMQPVYNTLTTEVRLPKILIFGEEGSSYYHRKQTIMSQKEILNSKPYLVIMQNNRETQHVAYNYVMPFKNGLCKMGVLHIQQILEDSIKLTLVEERLLPIKYINSKLNPIMFVNSVTYLIPEEKFLLIKNRDDKNLLNITPINFPNVITDNINASSVALTKGEVDEAWSHLSIIEDNPEAYNNLGIYYWLKGNKYKAERYFRKASIVDGQEKKANANLLMLKRYVIR